LKVMRGLESEGLQFMVGTGQLLGCFLEFLFF